MHLLAYLRTRFSLIFSSQRLRVLTAQNPSAEISFFRPNDISSMLKHYILPSKIIPHERFTPFPTILPFLFEHGGEFFSLQPYEEFSPWLDFTLVSLHVTVTLIH